MKIIISIAIVLISCDNTFAQRIINFNTNSTLSLPNNTKPLTLPEAKLFASQKFNSNPITLNSISNSDPQNMYIVGNVLVTLYPQKEHVLKSQLNKLIVGFKEMNKGDETYNAEIKKLDNFSVLITNYRFGTDVEYYRFFVSNDGNAPDISGILEFNPKDVAEGKQVLDNILANLKFKVQ